MGVNKNRKKPKSGARRKAANRWAQMSEAERLERVSKLRKGTGGDAPAHQADAQLPAAPAGTTVQPPAGPPPRPYAHGNGMTSEFRSMRVPEKMLEEFAALTGSDLQAQGPIATLRAGLILLRALRKP